jgi:hypothetical protein
MCQCYELTRMGSVLCRAFRGFFSGAQSVGRYPACRITLRSCGSLSSCQRIEALALRHTAYSYRLASSAARVRPLLTVSASRTGSRVVVEPSSADAGSNGGSTEPTWHGILVAKMLQSVGQPL